MSSESELARLRKVVQAVEKIVAESGPFTAGDGCRSFRTPGWHDLKAALAPLAAAANAPQPARPSVPPPEPGVRACCGDTHLGDGCDPDAGPSTAVLPEKEQHR